MASETKVESNGPALCVWCGETIASGDWDAATAIAASKEHVQWCSSAPWGKHIAMLETALRVASDALDRIRRGAGGTEAMGRLEMARFAALTIEQIADRFELVGNGAQP